MKLIVLILALFSLVGCGANSLVARQEAAVLVSTVYDDVPCRQLVGQRNDVAREAGVPADARVRFSSVWFGLGTVLPDFRTEAERRQDAARGKIMAMNDSLARRCGQGARN